MLLRLLVLAVVALAWRRESSSRGSRGKGSQSPRPCPRLLREGGRGRRTTPPMAEAKQGRWWWRRRRLGTALGARRRRPSDCVWRVVLRARMYIRAGGGGGQPPSRRSNFKAKEKSKQEQGTRPPGLICSIPSIDRSKSQPPTRPRMSYPVGQTPSRPSTPRSNRRGERQCPTPPTHTLKHDSALVWSKEWMGRSLSIDGSRPTT